MKKEVGKKYDRIAKDYSEKIYNNFWNNIIEFKPTVKEINKLKLKNKRVLDVGCGSGRYTKILLKGGAKVWGIDNSIGMIKIAKNYAKGAELKVGDACNTKYKNNSFDIVFSALTIEYLDRRKFFKEMNRILKKNGTLLFSMQVPYIETAERTGKGKLSFKFKDYFKEGKVYKYWPKFKIKMCFNHVTMQTLIREIIKNGFVIKDYIDMKPPAWSRKKYKNDYDRVVRLPPFSMMRLRKVR